MGEKKSQYIRDIKLTARCRGLTGALTSESFKISVPEVSISLEKQTSVKPLPASTYIRKK